MKTALLPVNGEMIGKLWICPDNSLLQAGDSMHVSIEGCDITLKIVEVVHDGLMVRRKVQADYGYEESRAKAKPGEWGGKRK